MKSMYKLRAENYLTDHQIVDKLNEQGFRTRKQNRRSKHDKTKIVAQVGGEELTVKTMQKMMLKPINAGINMEKWTDNKPVKSVFDGLVSIALFNKANRGKKIIEVDDQGEYIITKATTPQNILNRGTKTKEFAYRRFVLCPECERPLLGSATKGRNGKYYPAYHCSNHGHYFRVNRDELEEGVNEFVKQFIVPQERIDDLMTLVRMEYDKRCSSEQTEIESIDEKIAALRTEAEMTVNKLKILTNDTALKYMEEDLDRIEKQITAL